MADGADAAQVVSWILDHAGMPEDAVETSSKPRPAQPAAERPIGSEPRAAARYVLPAGALG